MGKLVAIGGGELRTGETAPLDRLAVRMTGASAPRLLFVPTASGDDPGYIETVRSVYGALGCQVDVLRLCAGAETDGDIRRKLDWADAFYVGGGDTAAMLERWRQRGVDEGLREAYRRGAVMAGISAGAVCWFEFGPSDGAGADLWSFARVRGLGLAPAACCPHYDSAPHGEFDALMEGLALPGVALSDGAAFVEEDGVYRVVKARPGAGAQILYMLRGKLCRRDLPDGETVKLQDYRD